MAGPPPAWGPAIPTKKRLTTEELLRRRLMTGADTPYQGVPKNRLQGEIMGLLKNYMQPTPSYEEVYAQQHGGQAPSAGATAGPRSRRFEPRTGEVLLDKRGQPMVRTSSGMLAYLPTPEEEPEEESPFAVFAKSAEESRRANLERYEDILNRYRGMRKDIMGEMEGYGASEEADIERRFKEQAAKMGQGLVSSGLYGTTVRPTMEAGIEREKGSALAQLRDRLKMMKAGLQQGLTQQELGFMERREDVGPSSDLIAQLMRALGMTAYSQ